MIFPGIILERLSCLVFSEFLGSVIWCLTLIGEILSSCCFKYFFCSFLSFVSFWYSHHVYVASLIVVPKFIDILFHFFQSLFLCFSILEVSIDILSISLTFLNHVQSTNETIKGILHLGYTIFLISSISFLFFLRISFYLCAVPICSCILSTLSIRALTMLIIVVSNSWSDNSNTLAISCLVLMLFLSL